MPGPLDGIRILDFTRYQQGPYATVMLSDLGADVLKVEEREKGDLGRSLGLQPDGWCAYFEAHNRNKRSITIDVRKPEGRAIIHRLLPAIDVVTDNFRPGVMARLGIGHDQLAAINPRVITASASGFGELGPTAAEPSFDSIGQAMGGIMVNQGGGPGNPPTSVMGGLADQVGAMVLALGVTSAIVARERQGIGQHVDCSLLGSQVALQAMQVTGFLRGMHQPQTPQRGLPTFTHFRAADGLSFTLGILDPKWWPGLCDVIGCSDLADDGRFASAAARQHHRLELLAELDAAFACRPRAEWITLLKKADIPCGPVNDYAAMVQEPQVVANEYVTTLEHPSLGRIGVVGSPIRMSVTPVGPQRVAPELGQHTEEVLLSLGYTWPQIEALKTAEVI
ncbi:MAG: CaiB/BaiF CoA transferase family protein [Tepidiformaceae bacterium]